VKSRIIKTTISHSRLVPVKHSFTYPGLYYLIDLNNPPSSSGVFSWSGFGILSLKEGDYLQRGAESLLEKARKQLEGEGFGEFKARILLVTNLRVFGYTFNPVSFYFCYNSEGQLGALMSEVNNTFGEKHLYVVPANPRSDRFFGQSAKDFHVSPFFDLNGHYQFRFSGVQDELDVAIDLFRGENLEISTRIQELSSLPFTNRALLLSLIRQPFDAILTFPRICWQAFLLKFSKKLKVYPKPNPLGRMTLRKKLPTLFQKFAMGRIFSLLRRLDKGRLDIELPEGETVSFGDPSAPERGLVIVRSYAAFTRILRFGDIGFGDSYVDGDWETPDLSGVLKVLTLNLEQVDDRALLWSWLGRAVNIARHMLCLNSIKNSRSNIQRHYDLSNDLFSAFLDRSMTYSCAIFEDEGSSLEDAQLRKIRELISKAELKSTDEVLEIGCGWGSFAITAAKEVGCRVTAITLSNEQKHFAEARIKELGLENLVTIRLIDYRLLEGSFDKIVSIEMIEAVGHRYFGQFFKKCDSLLRPGGKVVLQAITVPDKRYNGYRFGCDWIQRYIFPGGLCPSLGALRSAIAKNSSLAIHKVENFGMHYALTLREWRHRFTRSAEDLRKFGFDDTFKRQWTYYLTYCEEGFSCQALDTLHLVLEKPGEPL